MYINFWLKFSEITDIFVPSLGNLTCVWNRYLVGVEPPVLKLEYPAGAQPRYVSAVQRAPQHRAPAPPLVNPRTRKQGHC